MSAEESVRQLSHADYHVRYKAARRLAEIGDAAALPALLAAAGEFDPRDEDSKVNRFAATALVRLVERGCIGIEIVTNALLEDLANSSRVGSSREGWLRYSLAEALGTINRGSLTPAALDIAVGALREVLSRDNDKGAKGVAEAALQRITSS